VSSGLTKTDKLIAWYWEELNSIFPNDLNADGICQCGTDKLIENSNSSNQMQSFMLFGVFIDQLVYTHFKEFYQQFQQRFRFPKLENHPTFGMASPAWLVNSDHPRRSQHGEIDWKAARPIAYQLFADCLNFLETKSKDNLFFDRFLAIANKEVNIEFGKDAAQKFKSILDDLDTDRRASMEVQ
jgi:hypothetical protein